jgi:hypothetical protein
VQQSESRFAAAVNATKKKDRLSAVFPQINRLIVQAAAIAAEPFLVPR